jgi:hypothetical protein
MRRKQKKVERKIPLQLRSRGGVEEYKRRRGEL